MQISAEVPLNVASTSSEAIGCDMSNFADFPFYYGRKPIRYRSVESFYQALTHSDEKVRKSIAKMPGKQAKRAGVSQATQAMFDRKLYVFGSVEHQALLKDVIRAKLAQNPDLASRFLATAPRPLVHETAGEDSRRFPSAVFCRILGELRDELAVPGRSPRDRSDPGSF